MKKHLLLVFAVLLTLVSCSEDSSEAVVNQPNPQELTLDVIHNIGLQKVLTDYSDTPNLITVIKNLGITNAELVGLKYQGGLILTTTGKGYIVTEVDLAPQAWGCRGSEIPIYVTTGFDGKKNTQVIADKCPESAAASCYNLSLNGYDDWFLPLHQWVHGDDSIQFNLLINLNKAGKGNFSDGFYWASYRTDDDNTKAIAVNIKTGAVAEMDRSDLLNVRAIREITAQ